MSRSALALKTTEHDEEEAYSAYQAAPVFRASPRISSESESGFGFYELNPDVLKRRELRVVPKVRDAGFNRSFQLLQQWEGQVKEVTADSFVAIISDMTNPGNEEEEVEIGLEEVAPDDIRLLRPGSLFYWAVGYEDGRGVPRQRVSRIRFRRLPGLTTRDVARAKETARKFATLFD